MAKQDSAVQTVYTCTHCGRQGKAHQMSHVQMFGQPSMDAEGRIQNIVCGQCADDGRRWAGLRGFDFEVHDLVETLRILSANQRRREDEARAEAAREKAAKEFYGKLGNGVQNAEDSSRQAAAKVRRAADQAKRDSRSEEWETRRNGAANGYMVAVG